MTTLNEAIETITFEDNATLPPRNDAFWNAVRLGKEALKARKIWQDEEGFDPAEALPGETEE